MADMKVSPLHKAVEAGNIQAVHELIERGAQIDFRDKHNNTPLHYAST